MNSEVLTGVGLFGHAIGYLLVEKDYQMAFTDFMKGLGEFGVHESIRVAMQAPPGQPSPVFQAKTNK